jgi:hypothetical protein
MYADGSYVLISEFQRRFFDGVRISGVVYNGVDTASFPFNAEPGSYCVYLGDFRPDKRPAGVHPGCTKRGNSNPACRT